MVEEHRVTEAELCRQPAGFASVGDRLFNGLLMFGRGVERPGIEDGWEAWREIDGTMVVRITRAEGDGK